MQHRGLGDYFKLPIETLSSTDQHTLMPALKTDLELETTIHPTILKPTNQIDKLLLSRVYNIYTTNTEFLKETQSIVRNIPKTTSITENDANDLIEIWNDINEDQFHERYGYMDIDKLKFINRSSTLMHYWSISNLISPVFAILLPFLFILAPFLILRIKSVPITFSTYLDMLKDLAKSHAIGKTLSSLQDFSIQNVIYILFTVAMYGLQMYQNCQHCFRFYNNIFKLSDRLRHVQCHVLCTIKNIENLVDIINNNKLVHYVVFKNMLVEKLQVLKTLCTELNPACHTSIYHTTFGFISHIGDILNSYYLLMDNPEYKSAFAYSLGFESYWSGLQGLRGGLDSGILTAAEFTNTKSTCLKNQIYPALPSDASKPETKPVTNTIKFDKNIIITGPNASGKTTQLKATAINIILSQQFGVGYYTSARINPYTHFHSYLNIPDTSGRDSLFQAEARRCKEIIDAVDTSNPECKHFCIFDELFSGTNSEEAVIASFGFLKYIQQKSNVDFILTTHFTGLCMRVHKERANLRIKNMRMNAFMNQEQNDIIFSYKLVFGINNIKAARIILIKMGFPQSILDEFCHGNKD